MNGAVRFPPAESVPALLASIVPPADPEIRTRALVETLVRRRAEFGITRIGAVTRLDRLGVPVVQVVRPGSFSNAVIQGKGTTLLAATASAVMEAMEKFAAETVPAAAQLMAPAVERSERDRFIFSRALLRAAPPDADLRIISWVGGWDLVANSAVAVPTALVDLDYRYPLRDADLFTRSNTGLGAGSTFVEAVLQAGHEILERDAVAEAFAMHGFLDDYQLDLSTAPPSAATALIDAITRAGMTVAAWKLPARHAIPAIWCQVVEGPAADGGIGEYAPLPANGYCCHPSADISLLKAVLEACQARVAAISGAREDITSRAYPNRHDQRWLATWRDRIRHPDRTLPFEMSGPASPGVPGLLSALQASGAIAAVIVPLLVDRDSGIHVVRMIAPPLRHRSQ